MGNNRHIFASLDDFLPPGGGVHMVGRNMANYYFFRALMRYGTFDEYHFFLANRAHRALFEKQHTSFLSQLGVQHKVRLFDRVELPDALESIDYTVFHQSDHMTYLAPLARLRNQCGAAVPLTAFIHSLSYPSYMTRYLELNFSGLSPSDAILCSSECGLEVVRKCLDNASASGVCRSEVSLQPMPLGIDEQPATVSKKEARKMLGFAEDEVTALCFGRFSDFDKMDLFPLLQAFQAVAEPGRRMVLAGAVHDEEYYRILQLWVKALGLQRFVTFVEQPSDEQKQALFLGSDFFVSIADNPQETFGLTVLEAMSVGTPVIVSDFDGYRELAGDDAGIRVPTIWTEVPRLSRVEALMDMRTLHRYLAQSVCVDMDSLKEALRVMYADGEARERYGVQAKRRFDARFAHAVTISRLEQFWLAQKAQFRWAEERSIALEMNIAHTFSHYTTERLDASMQLFTTDFAKELLRAGVDYPLLPSMSEVVDSSLVKQIASFCFAEPEIRTVAEILDAFGDNWNTRLLLMWMWKHDLLAKKKTVRI